MQNIAKRVTANDGKLAFFAETQAYNLQQLAVFFAVQAAISKTIAHANARIPDKSPMAISLSSSINVLQSAAGHEVLPEVLPEDF